MTNILASVIICLVTNVVETHNGKDADCPYGGGCLVAGCSRDTTFIPATEKTKTTTVKRVHTIKFKWRGKEWSAEDAEEVSRKVEKWKKREQWEKEK